MGLSSRAVIAVLALIAMLVLATMGFSSEVMIIGVDLIAIYAIYVLVKRIGGIGRDK